MNIILRGLFSGLPVQDSKNNTASATKEAVQNVQEQEQEHTMTTGEQQLGAAAGAAAAASARRRSGTTTPARHDGVAVAPSPSSRDTTSLESIPARRGGSSLGGRLLSCCEAGIQPIIRTAIDQDLACYHHRGGGNSRVGGGGEGRGGRAGYAVGMTMARHDEEGGDSALFFRHCC